MATAKEEALGALGAISFAELGSEDRHAIIETTKRLRAEKPPGKEYPFVAERHPEIARRVDAWRSLVEQRQAATARFTELYARELQTAREALREVLADERLFQAIEWQSESASARIELMLKDGLADRNSKTRQRELLAAMYLQRYAAKNDTIGYFGPCSIAEIEERPEHVTRLVAAPRIVGRSEVFFEHWSMLSLARAIGRDPAARPWLRPLRSAKIFVAGSILYYPIGKTSELPAAYARLLALTDGTRSIGDLAGLLVDGTEEGFESVEELDEALAELVEQGLLETTPIAAVCQVRPDQALAEEIRRILPEPIATPWLDRLAALEQRRDAIAQADSLAAFRAARHALDADFEALTATSAHRAAGVTYGARDVCYLDCSRALELGFGSAFLERLAPLELVYATIRAYTAEIWQHLEPQFAALHASLAPSGEDVDFLQFISAANESFFTRESCERILARYQQAWQSALGIDGAVRRVERSVAGLRDVLAPILVAAGSGWPSARYLSPDLMIVAKDADAVRRGEYQIVVGEIHISTNTVLYPLFLKLAPETMAAAAAAYSEDMPPVLRATPGENFMLRATHYVPTDCSAVTYIDTGWPPATTDAARRVTIGELVVTRSVDGNDLIITTRDRRAWWRFVDGFDDYLHLRVPDSFKLMAGAYTPRVTVDGVVLWRESWLIAGPGKVGDEAAGFLDVRRWAETHGLPRRFFAKSPAEPKPVLVDLDNPFLVENFAKLAARVEKLALSEMIPGPDELWLPDADGNRYACELRMCALDPSTIE